MGSVFAETALEEILNWAESLPSGRVDFIVNRNPDVNSSNPDYFVDYEIKFTPKGKKTLGITIWISDDAIGFFIGNFSEASKILDTRVSGGVAHLTCAGSEPVTYINTESIIKICEDLSSSRIPIHGVIMKGELKGTYSKIFIMDNSRKLFSSGMSYRRARIYAYFRVAEIKEIPYEGW